jgi:hypothetical protein
MRMDHVMATEEVGLRFADLDAWSLTSSKNDHEHVKKAAARRRSRAMQP